LKVDQRIVIMESNFDFGNGIVDIP